MKFNTVVLEVSLPLYSGTFLLFSTFSAICWCENFLYGETLVDFFIVDDWVELLLELFANCSCWLFGEIIFWFDCCDGGEEDIEDMESDWGVLITSKKWEWLWCLLNEEKKSKVQKQISNCDLE